MSRIALPISVLALVVACGSDDGPGPTLPVDGGGGKTSSGGAAGAGNESGGSSGGSDASGGGGSGGNVATGASAGMGGAMPAMTCGDGQLDEAEDCDGDLGEMPCFLLGYQTGNVTCSESCTFDTSECAGVEQCFDGRDNDGDIFADCADPDCAAACESSCTMVPVLTDPAEITGTTEGAPREVRASCSAAGSDGREIVYQVTAAQTGRLEVELSAVQSLTVSIRTTCDDDGSEEGCGYNRTSLDVTEGDTLFVVVDGFETPNFGSFGLDVYTRALDVCGDGFLDAGEACDDKNLIDGDGCSDGCEVEATETSDNDTAANADLYVNPFHASIDPVGDVDVVAITVGAEQSSLTAEVLCSHDELDSFLEILDSDGTTVLASDDDGGRLECSKLSLTGLSTGTYYARISAGSEADRETFPYRLRVTVN